MRASEVLGDCADELTEVVLIFDCDEADGEDGNRLANACDDLVTRWRSLIALVEREQEADEQAIYDEGYRDRGNEEAELRDSLRSLFALYGPADERQCCISRTMAEPWAPPRGVVS